MKISIVTPSFKQLHWLRLCVASVADQKGVSVEHIIQDAQSGSELEEWVRTHSSAQLFVESDSGMYDAINRGFRRATGDILAWLNCDEQYLPGTLARVAAFFEQNPTVDVLFGDAILLDEQGEILSYRKVLKPMLLHTQLVHLCSLSCATFVRRSVIERGFLLDESYRAISDAVWVAAMLRAKLKMAMLNEPLAIFTMTGVNLGQSQRAFEEGARWRQQVKGHRLLQLPVIVWHRLRKLMEGAYARRDAAVEVYTADSPDRRVSKTRMRVPYRWPGS